LSSVLDLEPENDEALVDLAVLLLADGQPAPAVELLDRAMGIDPAPARTRYYHAAALAQTERVAEAQAVMAELAQDGGHPKYSAWARNFVAHEEGRR
jgi:Flp pilus assembly protein TadD